MDGVQRKLIRWALFLLVAAVPLVSSYQAKLLKELLTSVLAVLIASLWLLRPRVLPAPPPVLGGPVLALAGAAVLSLAASFSLPGLAASYQLVVLILLYWVGGRTLEGEPGVRRLMGIMTLVGLGAALVGIYQVFFPRAFHTWGWQGQAISTLANTNHAAAYLVTVIPVAVALALGAERSDLRLLFGGTAIVASFAAALTKARGAWVAATVALGVMVVLLMRGRGLRPRAWGLLGLGVLLAVAPAEMILRASGESVASRVATIFDPTYPTNRYRLEWWAESWQMFKDSPILGVGIGNYALARLPYARYVDPSPTTFLIVEHPHNEYLHVAVEMGLTGALAALWLLVATACMARRALRETDGTAAYLLTSASVASLAGGMAHSVFFYPWHSAASALQLWLILALLEVLGRRRASLSAYDGSSQAAEVPLSSPTVTAASSRWRFRSLPIAFVAALWTGLYWLSIKPFVADLYLERGNLKILFAGSAEAIADFQKSLAWEDFGYKASMRLGEVSLRAGKYPEAIRHFQRAVERSPGLPTAYANLGLSFYMAGRPDRAKEAYQKALAITTTYPVAHNNLGNLLLDEGLHMAAVEEYRRAIALNPSYANAHYNLGQALSRAGDREQAVEAYREAVRLDPRMAEGWYNLAALQARLGRKAEAIEALAKALTLDASVLQAALKDPDLAALVPSPHARHPPSGGRGEGEGLEGLR